MRLSRAAIGLILLVTLVVVSEGVLHDSHFHEDGGTSPTCAVCHNVHFGGTNAAVAVSALLLPSPDPIVVADTAAPPSINRSRSDETRAPPYLA